MTDAPYREVNRERTVSDIPDGDLVARVMLTLSSRKVKHRDRGRFLWEAVMATFGLGSTYAWQLCNRYKYDPESRVRK